GKDPAAGVPITIMSEGISSRGDGVPHIYTTQEVSSEKGGRFVFERVLPGRARIGRNLKLTPADGAREATSSCLFDVDFVAGATTQVDLGGSGRAVVGTLRPPRGFRGTVNWAFALIDVRPDGDGTENGLSCAATVDREGNFRLDDLPKGEYLLSAQFSRQPAGSLFGYRFVVPRTTEELEQPIDLGALDLNSQ
ncbi:MAG: hypothetical protein ACREJM_07765, partial [Candidatus Saccharimonadales bacterium]